MQCLHVVLQLLLDGRPSGVELVGQLLCPLPRIDRHLIIHSVQVQGVPKRVLGHSGSRLGSGLVCLPDKGVVENIIDDWVPCNLVLAWLVLWVFVNTAEMLGISSAYFKCITTFVALFGNPAHFFVNLSTKVSSLMR